MDSKTNIPLVRPTLVDWNEVEPLFAEVWQSGQLTTGRHTAVLEKAIAEVTGVKYAIAVSSCTSGMMLLLRAMELQGEVIIPSFTWASTGHALIWNQITPVFADIDPHTFTLDPEDVKSKITSETRAIFAANVFGVQPDMDRLQKVADEASLPLLCDSAQAIGATYKGRTAGSTAHAEVFSMSPTKVVTAVEGGVITTSDKKLADKIRQMRDYGKSATGADVEFFGLSARISEFHSIVGNANLTHYKKLIANRKAIADAYRKALAENDGISFQAIPEGWESSYNYFVILLEDPAGLQKTLADKGIQTKRYFYPPLHKQTSYACMDLAETSLPVTERISDHALALPFYSHMEMQEVQVVCHAIAEALRKLPG